MDITQRREKLKQMILEKQEIPVSELQGKFGVSNVTLRNDLIYLERKGVCKRLFGKIVANTGSFINYNYDTITHQEEKERIGKHAASLIKPNESVLIYAGTTAWQVARFVDPEIEFIAVTNSLLIALELQRLPKAHTVMLGGPLSQKHHATFGVQAIEQIREFNLDKLFISVDGIDVNMGITNALPFESELNRVILERAKQTIVVADYTKIGTVSFVQMGGIDQVDILVTDSNADAKTIQQIRNAGVDVQIV